MQEVTYYSDGYIQVTSEWIKLGERSYRVGEVREVEVCTTQVDTLRDAPYFLVTAGAITTFGFYNLERFLPKAWESVLSIVLALGILMGLLGLAVLLRQMFKKSESLYVLRLGGTFGHASPYASDDERYVCRIASAIKLSLNHQHAGYPATLPAQLEA